MIFEQHVDAYWLALLVENGSSAAFQMWDDFVTPVSLPKFEQVENSADVLK